MQHTVTFLKSTLAFRGSITIPVHWGYRVGPLLHKILKKQGMFPYETHNNTERFLWIFRKPRKGRNILKEEDLRARGYHVMSAREFQKNFGIVSPKLFVSDECFFLAYKLGEYDFSELILVDGRYTKDGGYSDFFYLQTFDKSKEKKSGN